MDITDRKKRRCEHNTRRIYYQRPFHCFNVVHIHTNTPKVVRVLILGVAFQAKVEIRAYGAPITRPFDENTATVTHGGITRHHPRYRARATPCRHVALWRGVGWGTGGSLLLLLERHGIAAAKSAQQPFCIIAHRQVCGGVAREM